MRKPYLFDEAAKKINIRFSYLTLLEFNGTRKVAKFMDSDFGEFSRIYRNVLNGKANHPERGKNKRSENMKKNVELSQKTVKSKYGVNNVSQLEFVKQKKIETSLINYGESHPTKSFLVQEKMKSTNIEKYGVENPSQSEAIKKKKMETSIKKYGEDHPAKSVEIKNKIRTTMLNRYGSEHPYQCKDLVDKSLQTKKENGNLHLIDGYSITEYIQTLEVSRAHADRLFKKNPELLLNYEKQYSYLELLVHKILDNNNISYKKNSYLKLDSKSYYTDITIEDYKLIIECDGIYFHSDVKIQDKKYHQKKQDFYKELGYKSLFFREDEINNKLSIIESIILAKLNLINNKVFARKTKIIELDSKTASQFFESNHLMGRGSGQCYALTYKDKIVSAIRIIKKKDYIDISRFCSALHTNVVGGLGKLLKHVIREHNPQKIISFVDMRYGDGHSLEKLGFVEKTNHVSFKWTDFKNTYHRMNFRKNSGYEKGLFKIWDCGQKKFELNFII